MNYFVNFGLRNKTSEVSVKLLSMCAEDSFERKKVFFLKKCFFSTISYLEQSFGSFAKTAFLSPEDSFEGKKLSKTVFFSSFLDLAQKRCTSTEKIQGGFSKLHSECPKDPSEGEHFLWEFILSFPMFEEKTIKFLWRLSVA